MQVFKVTYWVKTLADKWFDGEQNVLVHSDAMRAIVRCQQSSLGRLMVPDDPESKIVEWRLKGVNYVCDVHAADPNVIASYLEAEGLAHVEREGGSGSGREAGEQPDTVSFATANHTDQPLDVHAHQAQADETQGSDSGSP